MFILSEIMLISGATNFVIYGYYFQHSGGQAITLIIFALGAAGAAIGLVLIINFVKVQNSLSLIH
jgi:NADH:ubiquinone oxidoreductase subunit K